MNTPIDGKRVTEKFTQRKDLGIITVPENYVHERALTSFAECYRDRFDKYSQDITDVNFPNPTRVLRSGDRLHVRVFNPVVDSGTTTSEECMEFLTT